MAHMNWHKRFQAITHAYIETKMKNTIWRLITGKLYLGDIAQNYLISRKKPQAALKYMNTALIVLTHLPKAQFNINSGNVHAYRSFGRSSEIYLANSI